MKTSLKIDECGSTPADAVCLSCVLDAMNAIVKTARLRTFYYSREIKDPLLLQFLSRQGLAGLVLAAIAHNSCRTAFHICRKDKHIFLRINITQEKESAWFVELKFGAQGSVYGDGLLEEIIYHN